MVVSRPIVQIMRARGERQARRAYIALQDNDNSFSSSSSKEYEEANMFFMAKEES